MRVQLRPELLRWSRERAGVAVAAALRDKFPKLEAWEAGETQPTLKQLERFARTVHVPIGYLFLPAPPDERLPIPDFRTVGSTCVRRPSPDLLDMLYACQERQAWYREYAQTTRQPALGFVGSATLDSPPAVVAAEMRARLDFDVAARTVCPTWEAALRHFIRQADRLGVLVMISGVVLSNNRRRLNPEEFRGFALSHPSAALVFVNGSDTKAAQMFTLAHELAHLWLGSSAVSNASAVADTAARPKEVWCGLVATAFLGDLIAASTADAAARTASRPTRYLSRRFTRALVESTTEGHTLYRDAYRMLGVKKTETFQSLAHGVGLAAA